MIGLDSFHTDAFGQKILPRLFGRAVLVLITLDDQERFSHAWQMRGAIRLLGHLWMPEGITEADQADHIGLGLQP